MSIQLDHKIFNKRASLLLKQFNRSSEFEDAQSLLFIVGSSDGELSYQKSIALQNWWIGYEFPETITLVLKDKIVFLTSVKKGAILESLQKGENLVDFEILTKSKDEAQNAATFKKFIDLIPDGKQGIIPKENPTGKLVTEFKNAVTASGRTFETIDVTGAMATLFATKDEDEITATKAAAQITSLTMKNYFIDYMINLIDQGKKVKHELLADSLERTHTDERKRAKLKVPDDINWKLVEWCYPPIIQSGGKYDLKPSAQSNDQNLHAGTILCSFGARYKSYCSNIGRTFLINPEKQKEENYEFLLELQKHLFNIIRDGALCSDVYNTAVEYIEKKKPELKDFFVKNCGFGTGIEFRESNYLLGPKNSKPLKSGMVLNLVIGFQNLENKSSDPKNKVYSLLLGDTVQVTDDEPTILTEVDKDLSVISYTFGEEDDEETKIVEVTSKRGAILDSQLRKNESREDSLNKRAAHQKALAEKRHQEGLARYSGGKDGASEKQEVTFKKFESYRKETLIPKTNSDLRIVVDRKAETIVLPIYGQAVPFHVSTLKNVSKSDEGDHVLLRFNFITPGQATGKKEVHAFEDANSTFIRSLSYRSNDLARFSEISREITELKKDIHKRELERIEKAGLVEQGDLMEIKGRRPIRLPDVYVRPGLEGKRFAGDLEIHLNGLRYQSSVKSDQKIDILFSNIKHLFFQPCDGELIILIHIHLVDPIMIGKRKTKDVQFFRDVQDASFDETGNRRRRANYGDEDELAQEQEERRHRQILNREFQQFSEKISDASKKLVEVDVPLRELAFQGVPSRQLVSLQPTTECLVHLSDTPFLVITLNDFGLKNFDLVFVFKDLSRPVVHINTIPMTQLENVKEWLDSVDIPFTEGPVSLSWAQIMKTINDDPKSFFEEAGGWSFLRPDGSDLSEVEDSASEFEVESDASEEESESEESAAEDESDYSGSGSEEEEDESGEDWDELERKAEQETERLLAEPAPGIQAIPHEDNLRYFDVVISGPASTPFAVHGSLARAGKVKSHTPKVEPQEKKKKVTGRAKKRLLYTRRFVNAVATFGKRRMNQNPPGKSG
ncbi:FACT complex subunit spt16 [Terramyces sp. JEL0728]|nr:FACT complex subunit spt16 [Terramyces sp. JEL0728]